MEAFPMIQGEYQSSLKILKVWKLKFEGEGDLALIIRDGRKVLECL